MESANQKHFRENKENTELTKETLRNDIKNFIIKVAIEDGIHIDEGKLSYFSLIPVDIVLDMMKVNLKKSHDKHEGRLSNMIQELRDTIVDFVKRENNEEITINLSKERVTKLLEFKNRLENVVSSFE